MAAEGVDEATSLADQRRAIETAYEQRVAECQGRFAVTACVDRAREDRRRGLVPLRDREQALDALSRQRRAEQRRQQIADKQQALAARSVPPPQPAMATVREPASPGPAVEPQSLEVRTRERGEASNLRSREAEVRVQQRREREAKAQADRDRVAERQMQRSLRGKPVQPLPVSPAVAAPPR